MFIMGITVHFLKQRTSEVQYITLWKSKGQKLSQL